VAARLHIGTVVLALAIPFVTAAVRPDQAAVNSIGAAVAEFNKQVQAYMDVRQKAVSGFQPLKQDADQTTIAAREKALGEAIRAARAGAKPGELFTRPAARVFRSLIKADFRNRSAHGKKLRLDELPQFTPVVNETYPSTWPLQTFPPTLLAELPKLPSELEYRFVSDALILRDTKANIVVDYMRDVF
jgi:hypothetical protein